MATIPFRQGVNLIGPETWKVGELARRTGVSVRTLHYYEEVGLLAPSRRTAAGYRLYTARDVARLQQIKSLRHLGFTLEEVRDCLARPDFSPLRVTELHLARLGEQIALEQKLRERLRAVAARLRSAEEVSVEDFMTTIEVIGMTERLESYYTPEQLEQVRERGRLLGEERIRQVEAEWPTLIAQVRAELEQGTPPTNERVQQLARRWRELVHEFTGGNPGIGEALGKLWQQETSIHGQDTREVRALGEYVQKALAAEQQTE